LGGEEANRVFFDALALCPSVDCQRDAYGVEGINLKRRTDMAFHLVRGGKNVIAEVQRWQYFLRRQGIDQVGAIDGDFGLNSELATKFFQVREGIPTNGKVDDRTLAAASRIGYTIKPDDYYEKQAGANFPPRPNGLNSPSDASRNRDFGCFRFIQRPRDQRPDDEAIVIQGSCDGKSNDWVADNIVSVEIPQLRFARGYAGRFRCHAKAVPIVQALFAKWEADDLLHLILSYEGAFVPRYKRRQSPAGTAGHTAKNSVDVAALSNHSFGSAFDINFSDNQLGATPALCGMRGSVRELVAAANAFGVYWGGHFAGGADGMHFEVSKLK
jgi:D-alanyl-D-alanine carboxypeptidase/Putative peptidoglycan binding domain